MVLVLKQSLISCYCNLLQADELALRCSGVDANTQNVKQEELLHTKTTTYLSVKSNTSLLISDIAPVWTLYPLHSNTLHPPPYTTHLYFIHSIKIIMLTDLNGECNDKVIYIKIFINKKALWRGKKRKMTPVSFRKNLTYLKPFYGQPE